MLIYDEVSHRVAPLWFSITLRKMIVETYIYGNVFETAVVNCVLGVVVELRNGSLLAACFFSAAPSDSQGAPPVAPLLLTFAGHELIASVFPS